MSPIHTFIAFVLVGISMEVSFAEAQKEIHYYYQNQFHKNLSCQSLSLSSSPYYILNEDLNFQNEILTKGSIIDFNKKRVLRSRHQQKTIELNQTLPDTALDKPQKWNFRILKQKSPSTEAPALVGKVLEIYQINEKSTWAQRCCHEQRCEILPVYKVYEKNQPVALLAFSFKKSDFIEAFSLVEKNQTVNSPQAFNQSAGSQMHLPHSPTPTEPSLQIAAQAPPPPEAPSPFQQYVVCTQKDPLKIYDDSLENIVYRINRFQSIKVFQNWEGQREEKTKDTIQLIKVQAENARGQTINGWAAEKYIKKASECPSMGLVGSPTGETLIEDSTIVVDNNPGAYRFPTVNKPQQEYTRGAGRRYFGAPRNGRKHAACDLFRPQGEQVLAVANGKILRKYHFYAGTYAIEVKHDTGPVVRYGEVSSRSVAHSGVGDRVLKGQHIGYIDHLRMLHFEMFSDTVSGPLTQNRGAFSRRSDLMDPTSHLKKWEQETF